MKAPPRARLDAYIFDNACLLHSSTALGDGPALWQAKPINGSTITISGQELPIGVISAAIGSGGTVSFVMSTPSIWQRNSVAPGSFGLEKLMTAVMMHEGSHVFQAETYGARIAALQASQHLGDEEFNDDAIQMKFGGDTDFADSVEREIELFFAAAQAPTRAAAQKIAREARALMKARYSKYFVGAMAYQMQAEDLWLTMEGAGQWSGYGWLCLSRTRGGGGVAGQEALRDFNRSKWWTQREGLAIALTLDRLRAPGWRETLFGNGKSTLLEMLDAALAQAPK